MIPGAAAIAPSSYCLANATTRATAPCRIASFCRGDYRGEVRPHREASRSSYCREGCHVFGCRRGVEKAGDALLVHGLERSFRSRHIFLSGRLWQKFGEHFVRRIFEHARRFAAGIAPDLSANRIGRAGRDFASCNARVLASTVCPNDERTIIGRVVFSTSSVARLVFTPAGRMLSWNQLTTSSQAFGSVDVE